MTTQNLLELLITIIRLNPGCTAQELRFHLQKHEQLRVTRHEVNRLLYANRNLFNSDGGYIPRWFSEQTPKLVARTQPPRKSATATTSITRAGLYTWQREALKHWEADESLGVVEAVTGAGKTRVGLVAAVEELMKGGKVLVLVPTLESSQAVVRQVARMRPARTSQPTRWRLQG